MNQLMTGTKKEKTKKRIHKFLCWIAIITMCFQLTAGTRVRVNAAAEAAAALLAAVPISWPVVATVLIAGGVGTALYWASLDAAERSALVVNVKNKLKEEGLTLIDESADFVQGANFIKGAVEDGLVYIGEEYLNCFWDVANDMDLLGGIQEGTITYDNSQIFNVGDNFIIDDSINNVAAYQQLLINNFTSDNPSYVQPFRHAMNYITENLLEGYYIQCSMSPWGTPVYNIQFISYAELALLTCDYIYDNINSEWRYNCSSTIKTKKATVHYDGTVDISDSSIPYILSPKADNAPSSLGLGLEGSSGVPAGELGQVVDDGNGGWTVPYAPGDALNLDGYGVGYPVDVGGEVGAVWDPTLSLDWDTPINIPYDDGIDIPDIPDPDITQDKAQGKDDPDPIPPEIDKAYDGITYPGMEGFFAPAALLNKFPFCIPFDIKTFMSIFITNELTHAPRFVVPLNFSEFGHYTVTVDFTPYDGTAMLFRWLYLALFCLGIITKLNPLTNWI